MRIALRQTTEIGLRAGRILLGERSLSALGLLDSPLGTGADRRVKHIDDLVGHDVFVTDAVDDIEHDLRLASDAGIPCVTSVELSDPGPDTIAGANLRSGLALALADHESRRAGLPLEVSVAWTTTGQELRRGTPIAFPEPVGSLWARRIKSPLERSFVAPTTGEWAGISVQVTSGTDDGVSTRMVGVADLAIHLDAIALAAAAAIAADPGYPADVHEPWWSNAYLAKALEMGLTLATHTSHD